MRKKEELKRITYPEKFDGCRHNWVISEWEYWTWDKETDLFFKGKAKDANRKVAKRLLCLNCFEQRELNPTPSIPPK